ncbi:MAG TPA: tail fiber domain-containing protein [Bryobacteraceae bacterium]|nr:tail fiber domain-containing protein [Bryobacteraceae bacterium]
MTADLQGRYTVLLGANSRDGLPLDLFTNGTARWLGVQPALPGAGEQPRVLLVGVPYALKAADADTVGGLPASAFVQARQAAAGATVTLIPESAGGADAASPASSTGKAGPAASSSPAAICSVITSAAGGTANAVAKFDGACDLANSAITEANGRVGIGTTTPAAALDVKGATIVRGILQSPAIGAATASRGFNSQPADLVSSSFQSTTSTAVSQRFRWQAEPAGNNTSSPSGSLNLLFASGTGIPGETGLSITNTGIINFAPGQTIPTVSGDETVTGKLTATQLISTVPTGTAPMAVSSATQVPNLNASLLAGLPASAFQPAGAYATLGANTFAAAQIVGSGDLSVASGDINLPATTGATAGAVNLGGAPFMHACCPNSTHNTFVGPGAGNFTAGNLPSGLGENTAVGYQTLQALSAGVDNTALGAHALQSNALGWENTAIGVSALLSNTQGYYNTASGVGSLRGNTTGSGNTASGAYALSNVTNGTSNTASGAYALQAATSGDYNTVVGAGAGGGLRSGSGNILLGYNAGVNLSSNENSNIAIGNWGVAGDTGVIRIGNTPVQMKTYIAGVYAVTTGFSGAVPVLIDSAGQLGTASSSRRYKEDIHEMGVASEGLLRLRPVTFRYKHAYADGSKPIQYGLIAEEVAEVYPDLVVRNQVGQVESVQYYKLDAMLLNEVQKLAKAHAADQEHIVKLQSQITEQRKQIEARDQNTQSEMARLRAEVGRLAAMVGAKGNLAATAVGSGDR